MTRIGIIGYGVVGKATASLFDDVVIYDPPLGYNNVERLSSCSVLFLCVPVPTRDGRNDLRTAYAALDTIYPTLNNGQIIAVRSTVMPGTARAFSARYSRVRLVSNPEFLRAHQAIFDMHQPYRVVIGSEDAAATAFIQNMYQERLGSDTPFVLTDSTTAEFVKYAANAYVAMKISYANETYDACQRLGIRYDTVRTALSLDPRIGENEADAELMINPMRRGYDDECLPKDLAAFIPFLTDLGLPAQMFHATQNTNSEMLARKPELDLAADGSGG